MKIHGISIIITTLNEADYLPKLLESIRRQTYTGNVQIIMVDAQSNDGTHKIARDYSKKFANMTSISTSKRNISIQRNLGAQKAQYDYLLFTDADVIFPESFLASAINCMSGKNQTLSFLHLPTHFNFLDYLYIFAAYSFVFLNSLCNIALPGAPVILTTKKRHNEIGGFNADVFLVGLEDYIARSKSTRNPYKIYYYPFVYASTRRVQETGRIKMALFRLSVYFYIQKNGFIFDKDTFPYQLGHFGKPQSS